MTRYIPLIVALGTAILVLGSSLTALADDSAASIAEGGLVARRETRIVMAKEVLLISEKKMAGTSIVRRQNSLEGSAPMALSCLL